MKIIMAPVNIAGQPIQLVKELKNRGIQATLLEYTFEKGHVFGYPSDLVVNLRPDRQAAQIETIKTCLEQDYDIFHFWLRTFLYGRPYHDFAGLDIPYIKARGKKIIYRFTGYDLRLKSEDMSVNPFSAFHYGYDHGYDENMQRKYIAFLKENVDAFVVQDPEMHSFMPEAKIIPRVVDLTKFPLVGIEKNDNPLIVHAPSAKKVKGSEFVEAAIDQLTSEGLKFRYQPISGMNHSDAVKWYKKADIIVDQLHIGWYGVLALEGMALGKPVVVYIRDELIDQLDLPIPVENANPETVTNKLRLLIKDYDRRKELSRSARIFVEQIHDVKKVTDRLINLYSDVMSKECTCPSTTGDLEYFKAQLDLSANSLNFRYLAKRAIKSTLPSQWHSHAANLKNRLVQISRKLKNRSSQTGNRKGASPPGSSRLPKLKVATDAVYERKSNERIYVGDGKKNIGFVHFKQMHALSNTALKLQRKIKADLYLPDEPTSVLPALQLKEKFGGKIGWHVKEHPDLRQRVSGFSTFEKSNLPFFDLLNRMLHTMAADIDLAICTGKGYEILIRQMGITAYNINRKCPLPVRRADEKVIRDHLNLPHESVLVASPCNIYIASEFSHVLKVFRHLPEHYHLVHLGGFRPVDLGTAINFQAETMGLSDRYHPLGHLEHDRMITLLSGCNAGLAHFIADVEACRLSFHNRYADLIAAGLPFAYSDNVSMKHFCPDESYAVEYRWDDPKAMLEAIQKIVHNAERMRSHLYKTSARSQAEKSEVALKALTDNVSSATFISTRDLRSNFAARDLADQLLENQIQVNILCPDAQGKKHPVKWRQNSRLNIFTY